MGEAAGIDGQGNRSLLGIDPEEKATATAASQTSPDNSPFLKNLHVTTQTTDSGTTTFKVHPLIVSNVAAGMAPTTVTANQGNSGTQAWPVKLTAGQTIGAEITNVPGVSVTNFPTSQAVAVTNAPDVGVTNFPAGVSTVTAVVSNTANNTVQGSVNVSNAVSNAPHGFTEPSLFTHITLSVTTNVVVITSEASSVTIFVRGLTCGNSGTLPARLDLKHGTTVTEPQMMLAPEGGGYRGLFGYPMSIPTGIAMSAALHSAINGVMVNVEYFTHTSP